jgi:hypothetical protein
MSQQINLLQAAPRPNDRALLGLLAAVVATIALVFAYAYPAQRRAQLALAQADALEARVTPVRNALMAARGPAGDRASAAAVDAEITALKPRAQAATELMATIRSGQAGTPDGFSRQFSLLAAPARDDVWITGVEIAKGGHAMVITGRADRNDAAVQYARRLNEAYAPFGVQFRSIELKPEAPAGAASGAAPIAVAFKLS